MRAMTTLNQLGLLEIYKGTLDKYFNYKFQSPKGEWYKLIKEVGKAQGLRMAQAWYHILYFMLDDKR